MFTAAGIAITSLISAIVSTALAVTKMVVDSANLSKMQGHERSLQLKQIAHEREGQVYTMATKKQQQQIILLVAALAFILIVIIIKSRKN